MGRAFYRVYNCSCKGHFPLPAVKKWNADFVPRGPTGPKEYVSPPTFGRLEFDHQEPLAQAGARSVGSEGGSVGSEVQLTREKWEKCREALEPSRRRLSVPCPVSGGVQVLRCLGNVPIAVDRKCRGSANRSAIEVALHFLLAILASTVGHIKLKVLPAKVRSQPNENKKQYQDNQRSSNQR